MLNFVKKTYQKLADEAIILSSIKGERKYVVGTIYYREIGSALAIFPLRYLSLELFWHPKGIFVLKKKKLFVL